MVSNILHCKQVDIIPHELLCCLKLQTIKGIHILTQQDSTDKNGESQNKDDERCPSHYND